MHWLNIPLAGVGLLGGSLGLAIKQGRLADKVHGFVRRTASIQERKRLGVVDHATLDLHRAVENADLIILCTPLAQMHPITEQMLPAIKRGAIVTDVGSVSGRLIREFEPLVTSAGVHFVGSHPMAGAEKMGVSAARADLFENSVCVITPTANSDGAAVGQVEEFWRSVGARPLRLTPEIHDELVSRSSHLSHV